MSQFSALKSREGGQRGGSSAAQMEALLRCAELFRRPSGAANAAQVIAEQVHGIFPDAASALFRWENGHLKIISFAADNPQFGRDLETSLRTAGSPVVTTIAEASRGASGQYFLGGSADPVADVFPTLYYAPIPGLEEETILVLFLVAEQGLGSDDRTFLNALTELAGMAQINSELRHAADSKSEELQALLDICADVGSASSLEIFLQRFVVCAPKFLGYRAAFIALVEDGICRMRWASRDGLSRPLDAPLDSAIVQRVLQTQEPFWSDELRNERGIDSTLLLRFRVDQLFAMPLLASNGECLGILGLLDRIDRKPISPDDIRRTRALASQAAIALQSARNLDISERHRNRAETLVSFALELGESVELEELVNRFARRSMDLLGAKASFMALVRGARLQTVLFQELAEGRERQAVINGLNRSLEKFIACPSSKAIAISGEKFDQELSFAFGWRQVVLTPLLGNGNELLALLGLVDCRRHSSSDIELVQAMATHAAAALQNSQLFTRITRSSRQWAEMFDSISDLMLLHDDQQRVVRVNRSLSEKLNKQPAELLGLQVRDLFGYASTHPGCPFCADFRAQEFHEEFREPKTGNIYLVSSSRLRGVAEEAAQIVHVLKDVTASRRAERLYRELFDNIQEGAYFSAPDGRLLEVNDALVRMLGYDSREELLSVSAHDLYVEPAHREITTRALQQFGRLRNHELALLRRDRSIIYVLENSFVVRDETGKVVEYRGVLLDITEMKHVQSQLLREHDFNTQILNHTQSLIAVVDTAGLVSYANRRCCEVATGGDGDLVGSRLEAIVLASHRSALRSALECALDGKAVSNLELPLARGRETIGSFSVNLSPMRSASGEVNSVVAVMTDITDVAMLQAKLMHAEKMAAVGQLVSGVAHEVNNPLTAIMGFADLLLENPQLPNEVKDDLQVIVHESQRTREIVQNLLSFARQTPPQKQPVDINQVLRRTISLRAYDMGSHGIELAEELDSHLPEVIGDAHQLQQVFLNILNNACDAVREAGRRGKIVVTTARLGSVIEIRFRDNGTGIRNPDRIFDPFYTTKDVGKGTGLGLSICYGIVREHSGEIVCFNNQNGVGATFTIRLSLLEPKAKKAAPKAAGASW